MNLRRGGVLMFACLLLSAVVPALGPLGMGAAAQTPGGPDQVRALVYCDELSISMSLDNGFWNSIEISSVSAFSTTQGGAPIFEPITVTSPDSRHLDRHSWLELEAIAPTQWKHDRDTVYGVLIVTSAGVLMPSCDAGYSGLLDNPGTTPADIVDANRIQMTIAMLTVGRLESLRADDALHALLHPDVQAAVTPGGLSCWLDERYGEAASAQAGVTSTTVTSIATVDSWEWVAEGTTYDQAVAVSYSRAIGSGASARTVEGTAHFVWVYPSYRWFPDDQTVSLVSIGADCT